jgi:hypothetical protein
MKTLKKTYPYFLVLYGVICLISISGFASFGSSMQDEKVLKIVKSDTAIKASLVNHIN